MGRVNSIIPLMCKDGHFTLQETLQETGRDKAKRTNDAHVSCNMVAISSSIHMLLSAISSGQNASP